MDYVTNVALAILSGTVWLETMLYPSACFSPFFRLRVVVRVKELSTVKGGPA